MSIINEQNILGNPSLALAARVGSGMGSVADYSFANQADMWEKNLYEAMGNSRGGTWTQPTSYAGEVFQAEVEKEPAEPEVGVAGSPTQSIAEPTKYGPEWKGDMAESDASVAKTKLTQIAAVIAEEVDPVVPVVDSSKDAVRSATIVEEDAQGPVASGGEFFGYSANNEYHQNPQANRGAGATTEPQVIETTGVEPYVDVNAARFAPTTNSANDRPVARTQKAKSVGAYPSNQGAAKKPKTTGASTSKMPDDGGDTYVDPMAARFAPTINKVHKPKAAYVNPMAARFSNDGPKERGGRPMTFQPAKSQSSGQGGRSA